MLHLDHAVIAVTDLDLAIRDYRDLGFTVVRGGIHANRATQNALVIFLDGTYLELLAATGEAGLPGLIDFSVLLKDGEGLVGYALRADDLEAEVARLQSEGFPVSELIPGERRRHDGTVIQWRLALMDSGFAPFLIQDMTPRAWRVPNDKAVTAHPNRAIGIRYIELAVRSTDVPVWEHYVRLLDVPPEQVKRYIPPIGPIRYRGVGDEEILSTPIEELDAYPRMFGGSVPQAEIDAADAALEPEWFVYERESQKESIDQLRNSMEWHKARHAKLKNGSEIPFAIHLVREQTPDDRFKLEHTHNVHFWQLTGAPPNRGGHILIGLDTIDWGAIKHMYGPATDVPSHLRALASDDHTVRLHAYESLSNHIHHQGSVAEASAETVPFLVQLILAPEVGDKQWLRHRINSVTHACMWHPDLRERMQTILQTELPDYLANLDNPDVEVKRMCAAQLAFFKSQQEMVESILKARLVSDDSMIVRVECINSLYELWTASLNHTIPARKLSAEQANYFLSLMRDAAQPPAVHFQAAYILAKNESDVWWKVSLETFYKVMANVEAIASDSYLNSKWLNVTWVLADFPQELCDWLIEQAKHPDIEVRGRVAFSLRMLLDDNSSTLSVSDMLPVVVNLMRDPSPDVRDNALGFFYDKAYGRDVIDIIRDIAANDTSLAVRIVARNVIDSIPPEGAAIEG